MKALIQIGEEEIAFLQRKDFELLRRKGYPATITDELINGGLPYEFIPIIRTCEIEFLKQESTIVDLGIIVHQHLSELERQEDELNRRIGMVIKQLNSESSNGCLSPLATERFEDMKFTSFDLRNAIIDRESGRDRYVDGHMKQLVLDRSIYKH